MNKQPLTLDQIANVRLMQVRIHTLSLTELLSIITQANFTGQKILIAHVNVHAMNFAYTLPWFQQFLNNADIVFCDGFGVKWGARLLGLVIPHRYTAPDWIPLLCQVCIQYDFSLFFLGSRPGVTDKAATRLKEQLPNLRIVGSHHGYFDKTPDSAENKAMVQQINAAKPNILFVGFGMPLQERWLMENWDRIEANVAITGGAIFDYVSGELRRGPRWMTEHSLEWLGRLMIEPRRLWRRYLIGNPLFFWRVLKQRLLQIHRD